MQNMGMTDIKVWDIIHKAWARNIILYVVSEKPQDTVWLWQWRHSLLNIYYGHLAVLINTNAVYTENTIF